MNIRPLNFADGFSPSEVRYWEVLSPQTQRHIKLYYLTIRKFSTIEKARRRIGEVIYGAFIAVSQ